MPTDLFALLSPNNIILFVVVFTRLSGMMVTAPLFSTYPIPMQVKVWFMASIALVIFPIISAKIGFQTPSAMPELTLILIKEFMIGYIVGFVASVIFVAVQIAADLVSMEMGLTAAQALDPSTGATSPILSQGYTILASMIFIGLNGYTWLLGALYKTFTLIPPGYNFFIDGTITRNMIYLTSQMFTIGLQIAMPIFAVMILTDVLLGFTAKMMPKMNIYMVALPLKIYLGLALFVMLTPQTCTQISILIERHLSSILKILGG